MTFDLQTLVYELEQLTVLDAFRGLLLSAAALQSALLAYWGVEWALPRLLARLRSWRYRRQMGRLSSFMRGTRW